MRAIRYGVAMSLDGYIADANGGFDWIIADPEIDFAEMFRRYDTFLMGRRTYELTLSMPSPGGTEGMRTIVFSRTLDPRKHPDVTIVNDGWEETIRELRAAPGKDIWLFGGGELFRTMLNAGFVDGIDVGIIPVLVGGGIPFVATPAAQTKLKLTHHRLYTKTGIMMLSYDTLPRTAIKPTGRARQRKRAKG